MYQPTTRVLAVLELLQTHGRLSGTELAARLGVDTRTLRRYIVSLETLGIPVTAERGRFGGYALLPGFKLPPMMFTDDEALALAVGLLAARHLGLAGSAPAVTSAQAKLERIMPEGLRRRVGAIDASVRLDLAEGNPPGGAGALMALSGAVQARQRVRLRYRAPAGEATEREFDCYGLAYYAGFWYAAGMCHLRGALRTFRLDRVMEVRPVVRAFVRPDGFDPLERVRAAVATLPRAFSATVLLHTDVARARSCLPGYMGVLEQVDGAVLLKSAADELPWLARQLAALPFPFQIVDPPALRTALAEHAARLSQIASLG